MKHRNMLRVGQMRKFNKFLTRLAEQTKDPNRRIVLLSGRIRNNGQTVQKGETS